MKPKKPKSRSFSANKHASAGAHSSCHEPADGAKNAALDAELCSAREPMARLQSAASNARTRSVHELIDRLQPAAKARLTTGRALQAGLHSRAVNAAYAKRRKAAAAAEKARKKAALADAVEAASHPEKYGLNTVGGRTLTKHEAWWAKYGPIAEEIYEKREERIARRAYRLNMLAERFGDICEMTEGRAVAWRRAPGDHLCERAFLMFINDPGHAAYCSFMEHSSKHLARMKAAVRRPYYYEAERARRRELAAARRKITRRYTDNSCPTREQILAGWLNRRKSHADAIRFGSLIEDLECYIDNSLMRTDDGVIYGRNSGIKGWLQENIPALYLKYSTIMRYKAAAKKLKQITLLRDPTPIAAVVGDPAEAKCDYGADEIAEKGESSCLVRENGVEKGLGEGDGRGEGKCEGEGIGARRMGIKVPEVEVVRARAIWEEVVKGIGPSATALMERIDDLCDPERIEDTNMLEEMREKYRNEITVRTKSSWWRKLLQVSG